MRASQWGGNFLARTLFLKSVVSIVRIHFSNRNVPLSSSEQPKTMKITVLFLRVSGIPLTNNLRGYIPYLVGTGFVLFDDPWFLREALFPVYSNSI